VQMDKGRRHLTFSPDHQLHRGERAAVLWTWTMEPQSR
jgi:hypothetical protein